MRVFPALGLVLAAGLIAQEKPFLDVFFETKAGPKIEGETTASGFLARPATAGHLPSVVLLVEREDDRARQWARDLASTGFAVLAAGQDAQRAAQWLASQPYIDPQRMAVMGWPGTQGKAIELARSRKLAAAVLWGAASAPAGVSFPVFPVPADKPEDQAWVQVYEFLGQHVEGGAPQIARVVDLMRTINSNDGIRGQLAQSLLQPPASDAAWEQARSKAAIVAEAGNLLISRHPPKGNPEEWKQRATEYRDIALALLKAIEVHNYPAAQEALREMTPSCARCHVEFR
jgi:hypothetical protein